MACIIRDLQSQVENLRDEVSMLRNGIESHKKEMDSLRTRIDTPEKWQKKLCDYRFKVFPKTILQTSGQNYDMYNAFMTTCEKFVASHPGCIGLSVDNSGYLPAGNYRLQLAFIFSDGPWTVIPEFRSGKFAPILETDVDESDNTIHMLFATMCDAFPAMKVKKDDDRNTYTMFFNRDGIKKAKPKKQKDVKEKKEDGKKAKKVKKKKKDTSNVDMSNNHSNSSLGNSSLPKVEQVNHDDLDVEVK